MPFPTLSSDGLSITCFLADTDWDAAVSISHHFPVDITAGLSNRENRTPEAEANLLTAALKIYAEEAEAQALRQAFATIGKAWLGLPLVGDAFLGADVATLTARIYAPQRFLDLTVPAIVASDATLTADHVYAPLLVGHITQLPPLEPLADDKALCALTLTEDSPWTFRLGCVLTVAAGTWPAELLPDWISPPIETPVSGLVYDQIGQQRERTIADEERALHWTQEATFPFADKTAIATLLAFWIASRGPYTPFTAPFWFTPGDPSAEAPHASTVRFAEDVLTLDFTTDSVAEARLTFAQVPWEIEATAGETPLQPPRLYLYRITHAIPDPQVYRFTNCWRPLTRAADGTYEPAPMEHQAITGGLDLAQEHVSLLSFEFAGNPLAFFNSNILEAPLLLEIFALASDPLDPDAAALLWTGKIAGAPQEGRVYTADCLWLAGLLDQEIPGVRIGPLCNTYFLSPRCGHLRATWLKTGTLLSSLETVVTVTCADTAAADTYAPGKIEVGTGAAWESRSITHSEPIVGGQQFTLDRPIRQLATAQAVAYLRSCDRSKSRCIELDPAGWKARFRGHLIPQVNFSLPDFPADQPGKK